MATAGTSTPGPPSLLSRLPLFGITSIPWFHRACSPPTFHPVPFSQILLPLARVVNACVFPEALPSAVALLPPPGPGDSPAQHTGAA